MADEDRDAKVTQRYRELGGEEPSRELDASILAASRRAAETRPAPLVAPTGRRRWYFPLAAAAIIVLSVAVTVHVDQQRPETDMEAMSVDRTSAARAPAPAPAEAAKPAPAPSARAPSSAPMRDQRAERQLESARQAPQAAGQRDDSRFAPEPGPKPEAPPPVAQSAPAPEARPIPPAPVLREETRAADLASSTEKRSANAQGAAASAAAPAAARQRSNVAPVLMGQVASPEQTLQGIADLRRQGRHDEADKALVEFRKRFPDYRIPPETLEKVERR